MLFYTNMYYLENQYDKLVSDEKTYTNLDSCLESIDECVQGYGMRYVHTYIFDSDKDNVIMRDLSEHIPTQELPIHDYKYNREASRENY